MKEYKPRCEARIQARDRYESFHPPMCSRDGVVEHDGAWFCKIHDPIAIKQKAEARQAKWDAKWKIEQTTRNRQAVEYRACKGIPTKALEEGIIQEMIKVCNNLQQDDSLWSLHLRKAEAKAILNKLKATDNG
jgi:uncharacterized Zn finger protein (UPF0148 family)